MYGAQNAKEGDIIQISEQILTAIEDFPHVRQYCRKIPEDLWDLLLPQLPDEFESFEAVLKALPFKEEERDYVMELQQEYDVPLRPNETVKETMIRVRLASIRERRQRGGHQTRGELPIDPLE
jgi:hypothetical protein